MQKIVLFMAIVSLLFPACTKVETPQETKARMERESAEVKKVIEAHNANLERWYAVGDIDSVVTVFAEDTRQMPPNGATSVGHKQIREI